MMINNLIYFPGILHRKNTLKKILFQLIILQELHNQGNFQWI